MAARSSNLPRWTRGRRQLDGLRDSDPSDLRLRRACRRIEPATQDVLADHATEYWQRGAARRTATDAATGRPRVEWTIDRELVLELLVPSRGPSTLVVHDFSLLEPLRRVIRTRHVVVRLATVAELNASR